MKSTTIGEISPFYLKSAIHLKCPKIPIEALGNTGVFRMGSKRLDFQLFSETQHFFHYLRKYIILEISPKITKIAIFSPRAVWTANLQGYFRCFQWKYGEIVKKCGNRTFSLFSGKVEFTLKSAIFLKMLIFMENDLQNLQKRLVILGISDMDGKLTFYEKKLNFKLKM